MTLDELKKEYKEKHLKGEMPWEQYLAKKYLIDGDREVFRWLFNKSFFYLSEKGEEFGKGKISLRDFVTGACKMLREDEKFLVENGIATGYSKADDWIETERRYVALMRDLPVRNAIEIKAKYKAGAFVALSVFDTYAKKYIPSLKGETIRFHDTGMYIGNKGVEDASRESLQVGREARRLP